MPVLFISPFRMTCISHQERLLDHITKRLYHWSGVTRRSVSHIRCITTAIERCASSSRSAPKRSALERALRSRLDRNDQPTGGNFSPAQRPLNGCREKTDRERKKREVGANALLLVMDVVVRG